MIWAVRLAKSECDGRMKFSAVVVPQARVVKLRRF